MPKNNIFSYVPNEVKQYMAESVKASGKTGGVSEFVSGILIAWYEQHKGEKVKSMPVPAVKSVEVKPVTPAVSIEKDDERPVVARPMMPPRLVSQPSVPLPMPVSKPIEAPVQAPVQSIQPRKNKKKANDWDDWVEEADTSISDDIDAYARGDDYTSDISSDILLDDDLKDEGDLI